MELREVKLKLKKIKELTDNPFGVNIAMTSRIVQEIIDCACEEKIAMIITGAGMTAPNAKVCLDLHALAFLLLNNNIKNLKIFMKFENSFVNEKEAVTK